MRWSTRRLRSAASGGVAHPVAHRASCLTGDRHRGRSVDNSGGRCSPGGRRWHDDGCQRPAVLLPALLLLPLLRLPSPLGEPRHPRRVDQPDQLPARPEEPRPRRRHLAGAVHVREAAERGRRRAPAVEPAPRTRRVQRHRYMSTVFWTKRLLLRRFRAVAQRSQPAAGTSPHSIGPRQVPNERSATGGSPAPIRGTSKRAMFPIGRHRHRWLIHASSTATVPSASRGAVGEGWISRTGVLIERTTPHQTRGRTNQRDNGN